MNNKGIRSCLLITANSPFTSLQRMSLSRFSTDGNGLVDCIILAGQVP